MRKDHHVYVLHIAMIRSTYAHCTFPMVTSRELTHFRHLTSFGDAFHSQLGDDELVHRRGIEPAFLKVAAEVYRAVLMRAQAAATTTSLRSASGGSSVGVSFVVSLTDNARTSDALLPYPLLHESNYFNHEASGRKHARMLPNRVARGVTWIDALGQHIMNRKFCDGDSKRKRDGITRRMAQSSHMRRVIDNVGHKLADMPDNPPLRPVTAAEPTVLVPDEDQRWSFEFKNAS